MNKLQEKWKVLVPRWTARVWSLGPIFIMIVNILGEDENATGEIFWHDYLNLGLLGICVLGLALGWFNEKLGASITLITLAVFTIFFIITVKSSVVYMFILLLGVPAGLFYLAWWMENRQMEVER